MTISSQYSSPPIRVSLNSINKQNMSDVSEISFEVENCGSKILATSNLVVLACPTDSENKGKISVYLNDTMTLVEEL